HYPHASTNEKGPLHPSKPGFAFKTEVTPAPGEAVLTKNVNSAFIGTDLEAQLRKIGAEQLVIAGLTTQHCVSTTTRMAGNLGFEVYLVEDATAAFAITGPDGHRHDAESVHRLSLATLHDEFATVVPLKTVLNAVAGRESGTAAR